MIKTLSLALCLLVFPARADSPTATEPLEKSYKNFTDYIVSAGQNPDIAKVESLAQAVDDEAAKLLGDASLPTENHEKAFDLSMGAYALALGFDDKFESKLRNVVHQCKAKLPQSSVSCDGDFLLMQLDVPSMDAVGALDRIKQHLIDFPKTQYASPVAFTYAERLAQSDTAAADAFITEALKVLPGDVGLLGLRALMARVGQPVTFAFPSLDGGNYDIAKEKGKVVLIDFWATWCPPCRAMTPKMLQLYQDLNAKGVEIVGFSLDRDRKSLEDYVAQYGIGWPQIYLDKASDRSKVAQDWGVSGIPTLFVVGKDGNLAAIGTYDFNVAKRLVEAELKK